MAETKIIYQDLYNEITLVEDENNIVLTRTFYRQGRGSPPSRVITITLDKNERRLKGTFYDAWEEQEYTFADFPVGTSLEEDRLATLAKALRSVAKLEDFEKLNKEIREMQLRLRKQVWQYYVTLIEEIQELGIEEHIRRILFDYEVVLGIIRQYLSTTLPEMFEHLKKGMVEETR